MIRCRLTSTPGGRGTYEQGVVAPWVRQGRGCFGGRLQDRLHRDGGESGHRRRSARAASLVDRAGRQGAVSHRCRRQGHRRQDLRARLPGARPAGLARRAEPRLHDPRQPRRRRLHGHRPVAAGRGAQARSPGAGRRASARRPHAAERWRRRRAGLLWRGLPGAAGRDSAAARPAARHPDLPRLRPLRRGAPPDAVCAGSRPLGHGDGLQHAGELRRGALRAHRRADAAGTRRLCAAQRHHGLCRLQGRHGRLAVGR
jgi:hypothetical protein